MIQLNLTYEQFHDLFNALFEAENSLKRLEKLARQTSGADWLIEESAQEALRYKNLRRFISENKEVLL